MQKDTKGITLKKSDDFSEWYSQLVQKAELADIRFGLQGFIVHRPWGFFIIKKIYEYLEGELEKQGHMQFLFPTVVKETDLKKEKDHAGFTPNVFWVSEAGDKKIEERFALRPTGEAQIYPMYSLWFRSYKELPFKGYQSRIPAFRNEMTTRPFIRGREFLFFEAHNVFNSHEEAEKQIEDDLETCKKIINNKLCIPFFYFKRPVWDKFKGADNTYTADTLLPDGKRLQIASTHDLGQNFSKAFEIKVKNKGEKESFVWQTCFGPGIWRITAALIGIHGDDKGLIIPFEIAPIQIVIIPITFTDKILESEKVIKICKELENKLRNLNYRVKFDNSDETPGYKYNKWELMGVPIRIEIGPREVKENKISIALRTEDNKKQISIDSLENELKELSMKIDREISKKAEEYFKNNTREANNLKELKEIIKKHKGFIKIPFCSMEFSGEKCAAEIKSEAEGCDICGTLYPQEDIPSNEQRCIVCNNKSNHIVYVAKSY